MGHNLQKPGKVTAAKIVFQSLNSRSIVPKAEKMSEVLGFKMSLHHGRRENYSIGRLAEGYEE